jgi:hypothetical protein
MQKRLVRERSTTQAAQGTWLDLEDLVEVELTSEDPSHPIEAALLSSGGEGWRAAEPGPQEIRLLFLKPQRLRRVWLRFSEPALERTQEFVVRWSPDGGETWRELLRQQYTFSPSGATSEIEELRVDLAGVTILELGIVPDQGKGRAHASLAEWRLA